MIKEFDRVKIKTTNTTGIVVDIRTVSGTSRYLVEIDDEYNSLMDCTKEVLEKIDGG